MPPVIFFVWLAWFGTPYHAAVKRWKCTSYSHSKLHRVSSAHELAKFSWIHFYLVLKPVATRVGKGEGRVFYHPFTLSGVWELMWEKVRKFLKCLKICAFQCIKSLKMGFCEEQKSLNRIKIWTLISLHCLKPGTAPDWSMNNNNIIIVVVVVVVVIIIIIIAYTALFP